MEESSQVLGTFLLIMHQGGGMQHRKLVPVLPVVWILGVLLVSCIQPKQTILAPVPQPASARIVKPVTISFACFSPLLDDYKGLAKEFQAANPGITVQVVTVEELQNPDAASLSEALHQIASRADAFTYALHDPGAEQGLVRDLMPFLEADPLFNPDDFYPNALEIYRWHDGLWALPGSLNFQLIGYDKEAFDAADVAYPEVNWTYEEFVDKARQLTLRQGEEVVQYGFIDPWSNGLLSFVHGRAGALVDDATWPPQPVLDRPEVAEAVQWYADLALKHEAMPNIGQMDEGVVANLYRDKAAMWVDTLTSFEQHRKRDQMGIMVFPAGSYPANALMTWGHFMSAGTDHPQETWRWLAFLTRQKIGDTGIPSRRSVAEASGFWENLDEGATEVYRHALENAFIPEGAAVEDALREATRTVLAGKEVTEALSDVQNGLDFSGETELPSAPVVMVTPSLDEATTISVVLFADLELRKKLIDSFQRSHPDIHVQEQLPPLPPGLGGLKALAKRSDCFSWRAPPTPAERSYILNLQPLLDADPEFPLDDFYPQALAVSRWEGDLWALPYAMNLLVLSYNKDLFDAAGVAYPQPSWTWDDFLEKAVVLTKGEGATKQFGFTVIQIDQIRQFVQQQGGPLLDVTVNPPRPRFDDPAVVEATRRLADLVRVYDVMEPIPPPQNAAAHFDEMSRRDAMRDMGKVAMWTEISEAIGREDTVKLYKGTVPLPQGEGSVDLSGYFSYISADTEHPEACWEWIKFLSGRYLKRGTIPTRRTLAESDMFRNRVGEEAAIALLSSMERGDSGTQLGLYRAYPQLLRVYYWFWWAYDDIVKGADAEQAMGQAQRIAEAYILCLDDRGGFHDRQVALTCAREVDPDYRSSPWD